MTCQITELRYSLNGMTDGQLKLLFTQLEQLDSQVIIKRLPGGSNSLSLDDIVLEGVFPNQLIEVYSRSFPLPLSCKIEVDFDPIAYLSAFSSFQWKNDPLLFCGITLLPFSEVQKMISFENAWHFLRLIVTSEAGSILRPLLAVKPKGVIAARKSVLNFIFPFHRLDFLVKWLDQMPMGIDVNWLSGSTGDLGAELQQSVKSVDPRKIPNLETRLMQTSSDENLDFERLFHRSIAALGQ